MIILLDILFTIIVFSVAFWQVTKMFF